MAKKKSLDWALAPAPESADDVKINGQYELFINGKWQKPKSGKYFDTINPANNEFPTKLIDVCDEQQRLLV